MCVLNSLADLEIKEDIIVELENAQFPLVMWGGAEFAAEIMKYLEENHVVVNDVFVDASYYIENMKLGNLEIHTYEDVCKRYKKFNVILGHSNYEKCFMMEERKEVNKVYSFFSVNYGLFSRTPIQEIEDHSDEYDKIFDLLEDEESKNNYLALLKTRVSGNNKYVLDAFKHNMNFFNNDIFSVSEKETYLDIGAYNGDTIRLFMRECNGKYQYIYALEPDDINREKLNQYINEKKLKDIIVTEKGAWKKRDVLQFLTNNEQLSRVTSLKGVENAVSICVEPLDTMFTYTTKITLLKINYLSGVAEALSGAQNILREHMPKLAITIGFDCENIRKIPPLIKEINSRYKLYLRYNRGMVSSLTLYALV